MLGPDRERKRQRIAQLSQALGVHLLDQQRVTAASLSSMNIGALLRQHPSAGPVRLVVIDDAHKIPAAHAAVIESCLDAASTVACVVLLVDGPDGMSIGAPLRKLAARASVERFDAAQASARPFALVDAVSRGDAAAALGAMHEQLREGKEEVELVGLLVWQLHRWLTVKRGLETGWPVGRVAELAGIKDWQVERTVQDASAWTSERLSQLLQECWNVDVGIKTGKLVPRVALEALLVRVCLSRPAGRDGPPSLSSRAVSPPASRSSGGA